MKKLRKITALMLASCFMLTSCTGNTATEATTTQAEQTTTAADTVVTEETVTTEADINIYIEDGTFKLAGEEVWLTGMNAHWQSWNDFGGRYNEEYWSQVFAMMHEDGFNSCRIWITCSGEVGINIDENGYVSGATDQHWEDLDSLFSLAAENEIYIMATLMSFDHFKNTYRTYERWREWLQSEENIQSYVDNYVVPFCQRYDSNDYVWSVDLMNEPDWVFENEECGKISWDCLGDYFARAAAAIHENTDDMLVTVGFGIIKYNSDKYEGNYGSDEFLKSCYDNENAYLDFWSTHYYDWQVQWFSTPFITTPEQFGIDMSKPVVVGECSHEGIKVRVDKERYIKAIDECYEWAYDNGWNGVLAWTDRDLLNGDGVPQYAEVEKAGNLMQEKLK